jgi:NADPH-dependent 2,4-dienoyl-CoA reductase/sulfur reductase-like enzyme
LTGCRRSQNRWPSLAFDIGGLNNLASPFFAAGFYYKTFMWPKAAWKKVYEPVIRAAAGLGVAPSEPDPDHYANHFAPLRCAGDRRRCGRPFGCPCCGKMPGLR